MTRLYVTRPSPYARKARAAVLELGLEGEVELVELESRLPTMPKPDLDPLNPLGKVPALITGEGALIVDSPVIVAFLDAAAKGGRLIPEGAARWPALSLEALADGCMDAGVVLRLQGLKPEDRRDPQDIAAQQDKIERTLAYLDANPSWLDGPFHVGHLSLACAIEWLFFRALIPGLGDRPRLSAWLASVADRPALAQTRPA
jgi:glutathione S-transferase